MKRFTGKIRRIKSGIPALSIALVVGGAALMPISPVCAQLQLETRTQFDIFSGVNKVGPYTLSWNTLLGGRDYPFEVMVDGAILRADEYSIDAAKGQISFVRILSDKSMARVTYRIDPAAAKRNLNATNSPLTLPVTRFGDSTLSLMALPNGSNASKKGEVPLVWALGGKSQVLGGSFSTDFRFAGEDKSGVKLGFGRGDARNGVDVSFSRADKDFAANVGKALGWGDATERRALATRLSPTNYLLTTFSQTESVNLWNNERKNQDLYGIRLGGVGNLPTLNVTRREDLSVAANRQETSVTTDVIDLAARLDRMTSVKATNTASTSNMPDPNASATANDTTVTVTSAANGGAKQATATVNAGSKETKTALEQKRGVSIRLQPAPIFVVSAGQSEQKTRAVGANGAAGTPTTVISQNVGAEIMPLPGAKVTGSIAETQNNDLKVSTTNFGARVGEGKKIDISTGVTNRSTEAAGSHPLDTTRAQVALRPLNGFTVTGAYTWNPEDNGAVRQALRQELGIAATLGALQVGSTYTLTTLNGLAGYDQIDPQFGTVSLSLGMRFSRYTNLSGTYKDSLRNRSALAMGSGAMPSYLRSYGLGLTHTLGSAFNMALGGTLTEDRSRINQPTELKGEAKIGLRF